MSSVVKPPALLMSVAESMHTPSKILLKEEDNHKHEFQAATLIDSPIDFECK